MPWKETNVTDLRFEFVVRALQESTSFSSLCKEYDISPKTGYKWKERFMAEGLAGLSDQSRRPKTSPKELSGEAVCRIIALKQAHPTWGPRKLRHLWMLRFSGPVVPSESSFKRVLEKAGMVRKRKRRPANHSGQLKSEIDAKQPNDIWTIDFKGWWYTLEKEVCEPLTVRDLFSRYILCASPLIDGRSDTVRQEFERLFNQFGLPKVIRSDNGVPFVAPTAPLGLSRLSAWWVALGIDLDRIDPGKPYQNGAHERMHLDLAMEVERTVTGNLKDQIAALRTWRHTYNHERPHEGIGMRCPVQLYQKSERRFEGTPDQLDYPNGFLNRKVQQRGTISVESGWIPITTALAGWNVGLKPIDQRKYAVYFGRLNLGIIDMETRAFHHTLKQTKKKQGRRKG